ncbi:MAG: iron-containing alcohol dehydrogenase [Deltaproteobacteria bacterium]|jgi:alcohol dehydrogenase class IV|nr:iron-containing alcohol dehydrogenase [Deltaproteobacteria bacterium]
MARFTIPRDIYFGPDAIDSLTTLKGSKAIVCCGGSAMKKQGILDKVCNNLKKAGFQVETFENIEPDPSIETVMKGADKMRAFGPDWIVALGGGSPIDAAKCMWIFYEYPDSKFEEVAKPFNVPTLRTKAKFCAISSTSGTATEVTAFSVVTDYKTLIKYPLADYTLTPDVAIVDPEPPKGMPALLVSHTGMDALTHAIEAYVAGWHSPFSDCNALMAVDMINTHLLKSYQGNMASREQMHYAQCLAGIAFTNALLGIVHSMAHKTGAVWKIPHGLANAIYLPFVIQFNAKVCKERFATIARYIKIDGTNDEYLADALAQHVKDLNCKLNIKQTLKENGVDKADFDAKIRQISERALEDACTGSNPRPISVDEMERLFRYIYEGKNVDF